MAVIIIEGFDNTGKTTLAKSLAEKLDYKYVSGGGPEVGTYKKSLDKLKEEMPNKVQDRTWISEVIYGKVIRQEANISDKEIMDLINWHKDTKTFFIYAKLPFNEIMQTIDNRPQMEGVIQYATDLYLAYDYYMMVKLPNYLSIPIIYDYKRTLVNDVINTLKGMGLND